MMKRFLVAWLSVWALSSWVNAQSATDLNEGSRLTQTGSSGTYVLSWWGRTGRTYFIQQSDDLINWIYVPVVEGGTGGVIQWGFSSSTPRFFLALRHTDIATTDPLTADFDGDGLSNLEEVQQGFDPFVSDSDGDGIGDADESDFGLNRSGNDMLVSSASLLYDDVNRLVNASVPAVGAYSFGYDKEGNIISLQ